MNYEQCMLAASFLTAGMTEEDLYKLQKMIENVMLPLFCLNTSDKDSLYMIETYQHNGYSSLGLFIDTRFWLDFTETHDVVEYSMVTNQPGIWTEVH